MTETHGAGAGRDVGQVEEGGAVREGAGRTDGGADRHLDIDWVAAERSPEFRELETKKKAFVIPATLFFLAWYFGFILLAGYAPDFMGEEFLTDGFTVGYALALTQFIMTWGLGWLYLRQSDRVFDPLAKRAAAKAVEVGTGRGAGGGRVERSSGTEEVTR
jgi:uncharacterized membrane protein (DUF485 family)